MRLQSCFKTVCPHSPASQPIASLSLGRPNDPFHLALLPQPFLRIIYLNFELSWSGDPRHLLKQTPPQPFVSTHITVRHSSLDGFPNYNSFATCICSLFWNLCTYLFFFRVDQSCHFKGILEFSSTREPSNSRLDSLYLYAVSDPSFPLHSLSLLIHRIEPEPHFTIFSLFYETPFYPIVEKRESHVIKLKQNKREHQADSTNQVTVKRIRTLLAIDGSNLFGYCFRGTPLPPYSTSYQPIIVLLQLHIV